MVNSLPSNLIRNFRNPEHKVYTFLAEVSRLIRALLYRTFYHSFKLKIYFSNIVKFNFLTLLVMFFVGFFLFAFMQNYLNMKEFES